MTKFKPNDLVKFTKPQPGEELTVLKVVKVVIPTLTIQGPRSIETVKIDRVTLIDKMGIGDEVVLLSDYLDPEEENDERVFWTILDTRPGQVKIEIDQLHGNLGASVRWVSLAQVELFNNQSISERFY